MKKKIYISDCEGPLTKDDNAYEVASAFLKEGGRLFTILSAFDDYLGYVEKIKGYRFGSTLLYILPFLKAEGIRDKDLREISKRKITIVPKAQEVLREIGRFYNVYIVSTSYIHYLETVSQLFSIEMERIFSTEVNLDSYEMEKEERRILKRKAEIFLELPEISWDEGKRLKEEAKKSVSILKSFFFSELKNLPIYRWLKGVRIMGGEEKRKAVMTIIEKEGVSIEDVIYVGDSITDLEPLSYVREKGGLSVSFNGNRYAVLSADFAIISKDASILKEIAQRFFEEGKEGIKSGLFLKDTYVIKRGDRKEEDVILLSEKVRKEVRGEVVGSLG